jgi:hypothetical protein
MFKTTVLFALSALLGSTFYTHAANIEFTPAKDADHYPTVTIVGEIVASDANKFHAINTPSDTLVMLYSPGGLAGEAMDIGEIVHARKLETQVYKECYSACALIWVAGEKRHFHSEDKIGFHAPYYAESKGKKKKKIPSTSGSAEVGAYLNMLGLSYRFVRWATSSSPEDISLITQENASLMDLPIWVYTDADKARLHALEALDADVHPVHFYSLGHQYCDNIKEASEADRKVMWNKYLPKNKQDSDYFVASTDKLLSTTINPVELYCKDAIAALKDRGYGGRVVQEVHLAPTPSGIPLPEGTPKVRPAPTPPPAAPAAPTPAKPAHSDSTKFVASDSKSTIAFWTAVHLDCSPQPLATIRITTKPSHGTFTIVPTESYPNYPAGDYAKCNDRKISGNSIIYTPDAGYIGDDSADIFIIYSDGSAREVHYMLIVK